MKQHKNVGILRTVNIADILTGGGIGVMPTDTIYGIVGSALDKKAVERIYRLRKQNEKKTMIILIGDAGDLKLFGVETDRRIRNILKNVWPGKVSVVLTLGDMKHETRDRLKYLHRRTKTLAFRLPKPLWLRELLRITGPLVAPSANYEGMPPAKTIADAKKYFADKVDFCADAGHLDSKPSTLIRIERGKVIVIRP